MYTYVNMPFKKDFKLLSKFKTLSSYNEYKSQLEDFAIDHSKTLKECSICKNCAHSMKVQYGNCSNANCLIGGEKCEKQFKIIICLKKLKKQ